jgi:histidine triad (HIT) family protein
MSDCIFCKIIAREIPAQVVYEDDVALAFRDIHPAAPVHVLLVPKKHIVTLSDCDATEAAMLGHLLGLVPQIAKKTGCDVTRVDGVMGGGYKTVINTGPNGGQEVHHLHIHVLGGDRPWRGFK